MDAYQTHQPLLFACARDAILHGGEVIELGCGMHSTPQLAALCGGAFSAWETDKDWAKLIRKFGATVFGVTTYDDVPLRPCALLFVDNAPEERRKVDVARWFDVARLVVVHDSDKQYGAVYGLEESLALYPYRIDYTFASPNTTVVSRDLEAISRVQEVFRWMCSISSGK